MAPGMNYAVQNEWSCCWHNMAAPHEQEGEVAHGESVAYKLPGKTGTTFPVKVAVEPVTSHIEARCKTRDVAFNFLCQGEPFFDLLREA